MLSYNPDEFSEIHQTLSKSFALQRKTLVRVLGLEKRVAKLEKPNTDRSRKEKLKYMVSGDIDGKNYAETEKTINAEIDSQGAFKKFIQPDDIKPETLDEGESAIDKMRSLANALQSNFNNAIAKIEKNFKNLLSNFQNKQFLDPVKENKYDLRPPEDIQSVDSLKPIESSEDIKSDNSSMPVESSEDIKSDKTPEPVKKKRGRPKKLQTLEEIQADIDARNPTYISPVTGQRLPGLGPKKPRVDPKKLIPEKTDDDKNKLMDFLTSVLQPSLISIEENLSKILGNFEQQIESDKDAQDALRVSEELDSEKAREKKLEAPKGKSMIGKSIDKAMKPVSNVMDGIMNFFKNILLGSVVMGLIKILENPEIIMKPLRRFINGIAGFINLFIKGINFFILGPINFVVQGLLDGLQFILNPIGFLARKFNLGNFALPLDGLREKVPPMQIPEVPIMKGPKPNIPKEANMQGGGEVPGQGTGDTVPAMLEPGEFVMSKGAVDQIGVRQLEEVNAQGGGTNKPIMKGGRTYAKGGGSIDVKGRGNSGRMHMKDADGNTVGNPFGYGVVSGQPGTETVPQEMRKNMPGEGYPMPDGTYKVHSFDKHGPLGASLRGLGDWSAYVGSGDGNIGKRSGMMIHSDIDPYGTLGCLGIDLGGKPGTRAEKVFLNHWSKANPETITVDFGAPSGGAADMGGGTRSQTSDNSVAKISSSNSGSMTTPPSTPNGGGSDLIMAGGEKASSGGLTSGNAPASSTGSKRFSPVDARDDSNIIVQSIYNLVG